MHIPTIKAPNFSGSDNRPEREIKKFDKETLILIDCLDEGIIKSKDYFYKFFIQIEPFSCEEIVKYIKRNYMHFDLIFGWHDDLSSIANFKFYPYGTSWITSGNDVNRDNDFGIRNKKQRVTFLSGSKMNTPNQVLRHSVLGHKFSSKAEMEFYRNLPYLGPESGHGKDILFKDSMFSICIENFCMKNYFSEKIVDCFITSTVPIYCGCENIGDFFNKKGIITFRNIEDLKVKLEKIDEKMYYEMRDYIAENRDVARKYGDLFKSRLNEILSLNGY